MAPLYRSKTISPAAGWALVLAMALTAPPSQGQQSPTVVVTYLDLSLRPKAGRAKDRIRHLTEALQKEGLAAPASRPFKAPKNAALCFNDDKCLLQALAKADEPFAIAVGMLWDMDFLMLKIKLVDVQKGQVIKVLEKTSLDSPEDLASAMATWAKELIPQGTASQADKPAPQAPVLAHTPVATIPAGDPLILAITALDENAVAAAKVYFRAAGESLYSEIFMEQNGKEWTARLPSYFTEEAGRAVQYTIEAQDGSGTIVGQAASAEAPITVQILQAASPAGEHQAQQGEYNPWYTSWWFWTIVSAVVAGGTATALGLALTQGDDPTPTPPPPPPPGLPSAVTIEVIGPNPIP